MSFLHEFHILSFYGHVLLFMKISYTRTCIYACNLSYQNGNWINGFSLFLLIFRLLLGRAKRIWYLSHMRAAKVQASLRIRAVSPEPSLLAHTSSESRGTFRRKARSLAPLNGWACAAKICHDGMLEDTNSLVAALFTYNSELRWVETWTKTKTQ